MVIYTDGSCCGNGSTASRGGFGVVVVNENTNQAIATYQKHCENTTNNREELKAILWAMWNYGNKSNPPIVYSDSAYCVNSLTNWVWGWERNGWTKSDGRPPENLDIMSTFTALWKAGYHIQLTKIKGHAGHEWNEMADQLATGKIKLKGE